MSHHPNLADASLCSPPAMPGAILSEEGDNFEYALVTATVTDMLTGDDGLLHYHDRIAYRVDDVRYMPSARSEIQITNWTLSASHFTTVGRWYGAGSDSVSGHRRSGRDSV